MGNKPGIAPGQLAAESDVGMSTGDMSIPFLLSVQTVTGTTGYNLFNGAVPRDLRVIQAWGIMTAAGGASDTVVVKNGSNAITDTASVAVLSDTDAFSFSQLNDAYWDVDKGGTLTVTTASDALCKVYVMCEWRA